LTARKLVRKSVNRTRWLQYFSVAEENHRGVIHNYKGELWTPAAILLVHAVIAYTDALTIKAGGVKGSGDNHLQVVDLIRQVISLDRNDTIALNRLIKILSEKSKVAYSGKVYEVDPIVWTEFHRNKL